MEALRTGLSWFYLEFGIASVHKTGWNAYLMIFARTCRMFAYGSSSLMLALFFADLKFTDSQIGLFMTLTLVGDVIFGLVLTLIADRVGRKRILFGGSLLMVLSGTVFAYFENFWILLFAAVIGVVSTTGGDFGPFRSIEESIISQLTTPQTRSDVLAWYITLSTLGSACGSEAAGRIVENLRGRAGWTLIDAYHVLFLIYAIMGLVNAGFVYLLTDRCEADSFNKKYVELAQDELSRNVELHGPEQEIIEPTTTEPMQASAKSHVLRRWAASLFANISAETRKICYKLWALLALDSLADGMVSWSLTNYYMDTKFHPSKATLGDVQSIAYLLSTIGTIFAGPLAKRIGLINTMVFTHVPSSTAVLLTPMPSVFWLTVIFLFIRAGLNNMDQAPRAAFIAAVVKPQERTAVMGITTIVRTLGATVGPTITGLLAGNNRFWIAFVAGGSFRLAYDFGLYALFVNTKLHIHEAAEVETFELDSDQESDYANDAESSTESVGDTQDKQSLV